MTSIDGKNILVNVKYHVTNKLYVSKITICGNFIIPLHIIKPLPSNMKITFSDEALSELYETGKTTNRKYKQLCKNKKLVNGYIRAVNAMKGVPSTKELHFLSFLHYEKLTHDPRSSVRIVNGMVERLLFYETDDGIEVELIEIDSTHYGNKK